MSLIERNVRGQYEPDTNSIPADSLIAMIVREEYDAFITRVRDRLNTLSPTDLTDDDAPNLKDTIRSVLGQYLGASTAKAAMNFIKKPNSWNVFCQENYARIASELNDDGQSPTSMIFF